MVMQCCTACFGGERNRLAPADAATATEDPLSKAVQKGAGAAAVAGGVLSATGQGKETSAEETKTEPPPAPAKKGLPSVEAPKEEVPHMEEAKTPAKNARASHRSPKPPAVSAAAISEAIETLKTQGVAIQKHCKDHKIRPRTLELTDAQDKLLWIPPKPKFGVAFHHRDDKPVELDTIVEVRPGTKLDPSTVGGVKRPKGMTGTPTLRRTADGVQVARRAVSLIAPGDKTYDIEFETKELANLYTKVFEKLVADATKK